MTYALFRIFTAIGLLLLFISMSFGEDMVKPTDSLATIGERTITVGNFVAEMERRGAGLPGSFSVPEQREELLNSMIRLEMAYAAALKEGYDRRPEVLEQLRHIIVSQYRKENLDPGLEKVAVSDGDVTAYYESHLTELVTPETRRAAVIEISIPKKASPEVLADLLKRAEAARAEASQLGPETASFGGIAVRYSDDQLSRYRGGDTGLLTKADAEKSRWGRDVGETIFALKVPGEVSPVLRAAEGYFLVKLMDVKQSVPRPIAEVKDLIRNRLYFERIRGAEKAFYDSLASKVKVKVNQELLKAIGSPPVGKKIEPPALPGK